MGRNEEGESSISVKKKEGAVSMPQAMLLMRVDEDKDGATYKVVAAGDFSLTSTSDFPRLLRGEQPKEKKDGRKARADVTREKIRIELDEKKETDPGKIHDDTGISRPTISKYAGELGYAVSRGPHPKIFKPGEEKAQPRHRRTPRERAAQMKELTKLAYPSEKIEKNQRERAAELRELIKPLAEAGELNTFKLAKKLSNKTRTVTPAQASYALGKLGFEPEHKHGPAKDEEGKTAVSKKREAKVKTALETILKDKEATSLGEVSEVVKFSNETVSKYVRKLEGYKITMGPHAKIIKLKKEEESQGEQPPAPREEIGVKAPRVDGRKAKADENKEKVKKELENGEDSLGTIHGHTGISKPTISKYLGPLGYAVSKGKNAKITKIQKEDLGTSPSESAETEDAAEQILKLDGRLAKAIANKANVKAELENGATDLGTIHDHIGISKLTISKYVAELGYATSKGPHPKITKIDSESTAESVTKSEPDLRAARRESVEMKQEKVIVKPLQEPLVRMHEPGDEHAVIIQHVPGPVKINDGVLAGYVEKTVPISVIKGIEEIGKTLISAPEKKAFLILIEELKKLNKSGTQLFSGTAPTEVTQEAMGPIRKRMGMDTDFSVDYGDHPGAFFRRAFVHNIAKTDGKGGVNWVIDVPEPKVRYILKGLDERLMVGGF